MKISKTVFPVAAMLLVAVSPRTSESAVKVRQIVRPPRTTIGNANICRQYEIEEADWIRSPQQVEEPAFWRFEREFMSDGTPLTVDVSADERFVLLLDGEMIGRGPNRSSVGNWVFHTWQIEMSPGRHVLSAVVWQAKDFAPAAQITYGKGGGFILKADGAYDRFLTTGKAPWRVGRLSCIRFDEDVHDSRADGAGYAAEQCAPGFLSEVPTLWEKPVTVFSASRLPPAVTYGARRAGWTLYPTTLPDQIAHRVFPGEFRSGGEMKLPIRLGPGEKRTILWDLGNYYCAYPVVKASGGRGSKIVWGWAETLFDSVSPQRPGWGRKGDRSAWKGKKFLGTADVFYPDGATGVEMTVPWWRCGRWCRLELEAGEKALEIESLAIVETRYPLEDEGSFACDQTSLASLQPFCLRGMQMCAHETMVDCPFYEQQMYGADTRIQLNILSALTADRRMNRRAIELLDFARRGDGFCAMNFPSAVRQESSTFTLPWMMMFGDYVMRQRADEWLRFRKPGLMSAAYGFKAYEKEDGLVSGLPGWNFVDWVPTWEKGVPPDAESADRPSCVVNLFWVLAQQAVAKVAEVTGDDAEAKLWTGRARRTAASLNERFWDPSRALLADDVEHRFFSELAQSLAIVGDVIPPERQEAAFRSLLSRGDLAKATVYSSYYLFEAAFKMRRADVFFDRMDMWRKFIAMGLKTPLESPSTFKDCDARSDCHAWGSHPLYFMRTGLAGIRPSAPGFSRVEINPCPGPLKIIKATYPHPDGKIEVDFVFDGKNVSGIIRTPVPGVFRWQDRRVELVKGENAL